MAKTKPKELFLQQYKAILTALWDNDYNFQKTAKTLGITLYVPFLSGIYSLCRRELKSNIAALSKVGYVFDLPETTSIEMKVEVPQVPDYLKNYYFDCIVNEDENNFNPYDEKLLVYIFRSCNSPLSRSCMRGEALNIQDQRREEVVKRLPVMMMMYPTNESLLQLNRTRLKWQ